MSIFETLNAINVNDKTEKKNGLTYLSWAWAWGEVKKVAPDATFTIYERFVAEFGPVNYFTDGRTCWVKTGLTINGLEHIEELPVMDFRNNPIPYDKVTSTDVNKAIQRSLTKAAARHGLGLYIYAGEDLPEVEQEEQKQESKPEKPLKERIDAAVKNVEVVKASQVPPIPKKEEPKKEVNPVTQFLLTAMSGFRQKRGISAAENNKLFAKQKEELVKRGLAPDKKSEDYTMDEAAALIDAMDRCFDLLGTELKTE